MQLRLTNILKEYSTGIINKLKQNFKQQNSALTDQQMEYYINRFDQLKSSPKVEQKDITKYTFAQLEQIVDSFPTKEKIKKQGGENNVEFSQTELIYNQPPLQIFHGDSEKTCIKIKGDFPATWCIARSSGGNMYKNYRYRGQEPSFYFVKNLERMNKIKDLEDDKYCFFVVQYNNEKKYIVTSALNDGDKEISWDEIVKIEPLLQGKESLFKHVPLTDIEKKYYKKFREGITDEEYKNLSYEEKKYYISIRNHLTNEQFFITPKDLINDYITKGNNLSDEQLDFITDKKQLLDNYKRVTLNISIPSYLKGIENLDNRWSLLTDDEAIELYERKRSNIVNILLYKPTLIKYFKDRIPYFDERDIQDILVKQPSLIKYFEDRLEGLDTQQIAEILVKQPSLVKYFEDRLNEFHINDIYTVLLKQPNFINYFKDNLMGMESYKIQSILVKQPSLIKYFKNILKKLEDYEISYILTKQPSLKPYFEKEGLLNESLKYPPLRNILKK